MKIVFTGRTYNFVGLIMFRLNQSLTWYRSTHDSRCICLKVMFLFADSISKLFIWIPAEVRSCALQYVFLSTKSALGVWSHYALEVAEKVVLTVYICTNDLKNFNGVRGLFYGC